MNNFRFLVSTFRVLQARRTSSSTTDTGDKSYAMKEVRCLWSKYFYKIFIVLIFNKVVTLLIIITVVKLLFKVWCCSLFQKDENSKEIDLQGEGPKGQATKEEATSPEQQPGFLWKISGGVYNKAATVVGGVGWVAGTALSTTYSAVTAVGGVALTPFRKSEKDKSD